MERELEFKGMSRKELSFLSNVPMTTINRAIERDSKVFAEDALRVAKVLGVSIELLLEIPNDNHECKICFGETQNLCLFKKYYSVLKALESMPDDRRKTLCKLIEEIT